MNKVLNIIKNIIIGLFIAISTISIVTIITLNLTGIYKVIIDKYNLESVTGLSSESLMVNFKGLIRYLQNPFIDKLMFEDFIMSANGEIHFQEVKNIFITLIVISIIFIIYLVIDSIYGRKKGKYFNNILRKLNCGANTLIIFFVGLIVAYIIDFSKAFVVFHKIFFRNNYWLFDAKTDPIINALPEELFMIYGAIILGFILIISVIIKVLNNRNEGIVMSNNSDFIMKG